MIGGPGAGESELFEVIRSQAQLLENVDFLGFVPYAQVDVEFDRASVFVNTSDSEGFPNTFLQAWARGVPTVSFIDAGARLDGKDVGLRARSLAEMIQAVGELTSNDARRELEGRRCYSYFERCHSPERILDLYEQTIRELKTDPHDSAGRNGDHRNSKTIGDA
jgi:glycosyltransferase involved in cell wall biosynthesis